MQSSRSEGFPLTGYFIPGHDGTSSDWGPGLAWPGLDHGLGPNRALPRPIEVRGLGAILSMIYPDELVD